MKTASDTTNDKTMNKPTEAARLLVTPISELSEEQVTYIIANRAELNAIKGTADHIAALHERSAADQAKRAARKLAEKLAAKESRRRIADDRAFRAHLRSYLA